MPYNPKSLRNLQPLTDETRGDGRKNAGLSINEWRNALAAKPEEDIKAVLDDPKAPACKVIAARELLDAIAGDDRAISRVCDYTNGKATQPTVNQSEVVHVRTTVIRVPASDSGN